MAGAWTPARIRSFIISVLRSGTRRWPAKYETLNEAKTATKKNPKTGRMAQHYLCASCQEDFPAKEVQADHVEPVVDQSVGFVDWNTYIERLFCSKDNYQILCLTCHKTKSATERETKPCKPKSSPKPKTARSPSKPKPPKKK